MRILITGGGGYVGSILTPVLLEHGHAVTVLDLFSADGAALAGCCRYEGFEVVRGDARDTRLLDALLPRHDGVVPLAARVGASSCERDPIGAVSINREAVRALLERMRPDQRLVYPTTNSGYGIGAAGAPCTEASPLNPVSLYGVTKVEAERAVLESGRGVSLRLATVFGVAPRMRVDLLVNDFTRRAMQDKALVVFEGQFRRNYIHVRDVAKTVLHVLDNYDAMAGQAFNVGLSSANLSKLELCARIKAQLPAFQYFEAAIGEDPDKRDYVVSNAKLEATGWTPDWSLEAGIAELIKAYRMLNVVNFSNG